MSSPAEPGLAIASRSLGRAFSPVPLVFAFTIGALALLQLPALPPLWLWLLPLAAALFRSRWRGLLLAFAIGAALTAQRASELIDQRWPVSRYGEVPTVEGIVASLPQASSTTTPDGGDKPGDEAADSLRTWRFRFDPLDGGLPEHIRAAWYRSRETLRGGDCWRLTLSLRTPHGSRNPGGFDYEGWLFRQGIAATATVRSGERCEASGGHALLKLRQGFADRLAAWLPGHPALPMVAALTLGDTSGLDEDDWQAFRLTGTTHLVAISGFNVAIVAGVVFWLIRWLWSRSAPLSQRLPAPRAALLASVIAALLYALLAGFEPPVQRAAWMLGLLVLAGWWGGLGQPSRALALAWAVIVASDPLSLLSPGLWLSFSAVAAIFYVSGGRLAPVNGWRAALSIQLMLSVMLAPLTLYWFQGTSLTGPLVNLIAVPAAAVLTPALLLALLLAAVVPVLGLPLLHRVADVLALAQDGLLWIAEQTPQAWLAASPEPAALLLALLGAIALFAPAGLPTRVFGLLALSALALPLARTVDKGFRLSVLDVGQGLAVVVQTREHTLLFDAGPAWPGSFDAGRSVVVPYLLRSGVRGIDRLIVSHGDLDHRGGVAAVAAVLPIASRSGYGTDTPCRAGERWDWDGVSFELLAGPERGLSDNDGSCVLRVAQGDQALLLTGDIEARAEARLLTAMPEKLRADVLVTPHHGSRTSSTAEFLDAVQPKLAIHSAGWHHHFGHPARVVVARMQERGIAQVSTGDHGAVTVEMSGDRLVCERYRPKALRLWSTPADEVWRSGLPSSIGPCR